MKTVTYRGPLASLEIRPPYHEGVVIERGEPVALPDDLATALVAEYPGDFVVAAEKKDGA